MVVIVEYTVEMHEHVFDIRLLVLLLDLLYQMLFQLMHVIVINDLIHCVNLWVENEVILDLNHQNVKLIMNVNVHQGQYEYAKTNEKIRNNKKNIAYENFTYSFRTVEVDFLCAVRCS